jgi:hypothetical protein
MQTAIVFNFKMQLLDFSSKKPLLSPKNDVKIIGKLNSGTPQYKCLKKPLRRLQGLF